MSNSVRVIPRDLHKNVIARRALYNNILVNTPRNDLISTARFYVLAVSPKKRYRVCAETMRRNDTGLPSRVLSGARSVVAHVVEPISTGTVITLTGTLTPTCPNAVSTTADESYTANGPLTATTSYASCGPSTSIGPTTANGPSTSNGTYTAGESSAIIASLTAGRLLTHLPSGTAEDLGTAFVSTTTGESFTSFGPSTAVGTLAENHPSTSGAESTSLLNITAQDPATTFGPETTSAPSSTHRRN